MSLFPGIAVCGSGLGTFLFAPITSVLIENYGWRGAMAIIGALILNCVPLGLIFKPVPEIPQTPATEPMLSKQAKSPLKRSQSTEHVLRANGKVDDNDIARLTLSQPALNKPHEQKPPPSRHGSGIMQRPDVLYQGSMTSLARFRSTSPERVFTAVSTKEEPEVKCGWLPCSTEFKAALGEMLDMTLLVDPIFILFAVSNFLTSIGFYIPYVYTVPMSESLGIENPPYLISIIGGSNLVGRIILGYISDKPWVNRLLAYNVCLTIAGIGMYIVVIFLNKHVSNSLQIINYHVVSRYGNGHGLLGVLGSRFICYHIRLLHRRLRGTDLCGSCGSIRYREAHKRIWTPTTVPRNCFTNRSAICR